MFGESEIGGRIVPALAGTLAIPVIFLLLDRQVGRAAAVLAALLVAVWPTHLSHSYDVRFYTIASFFTFVAVLLGGVALRLRSNRYLAASLLLIFPAVLSHTVTALAFPMIVGGILVGFWMDGQQPQDGFWKYVLTIGAALLLLGFFHVLPLLRNWNGGAAWGMNSPHAIFNMINALGWPSVLLLLLGVVSAIATGTVVAWYWLTCLAGLAAATVLLPKLLTYHGAYAFPFTLAAFVLIAFGATQIYAKLHATNAGLAWCWLALVLLASAPSLVSFFSDGTSPDHAPRPTPRSVNWRARGVVRSGGPSVLTRSATRLGLICLARRLVRGRRAPCLIRRARGRARDCGTGFSRRNSTVDGRGFGCRIRRRGRRSSRGAGGAY